MEETLRALEFVLSGRACASVDAAGLRRALPPAGERTVFDPATDERGKRGPELRTFGRPDHRFVKERLVAKPGPLDSAATLDRGGAADAYVHLRLFLVEKEAKKGAVDFSVPIIFNVYSYWDRDGYWVGVAQEAFGEDRTAHNVLCEAHAAGGLPGAEKCARSMLGEACARLRRMQERFWLTHNDLHLGNLYVRMSGAVVVADFDRASFCVASVASQNEVVVYHPWWYLSSTKALRDAHQLVAETVGVLEAYAHSGRDPLEAPLTRALLRLFLEDKNIRARMPNAVFLGACTDSPTTRDVCEALVGPITTPAVGDSATPFFWAGYEYVARTFPTQTLPEGHNAGSFCEYAWLPRAAAPAGPRDVWAVAWSLLRVKSLVERWSRASFAFFMSADARDPFSANTAALSARRRVVLFVNAVENLQRTFALLYETYASGTASWRGEADPFVMLLACHFALFGQSPLVRGNEDDPAVFADRHARAARLAISLRADFIPSEAAARRRLMQTGSVRRLAGGSDFEHFVNAFLFPPPQRGGGSGRDPSWPVHAALAFVHPDVLYAGASLTLREVRAVTELSRATYRCLM